MAPTGAGPEEAAMIPLILLGAAVLGAVVIFGYSSFAVVFLLLEDHQRCRS